MQDLIADLNVKGLDNWVALHFAANEGQEEIVKELLLHPDIQIEALSSIGRTPLHLASIRGYTKIVRLLVSNGANVNVKDNDENTPLHYSSEFGHFECIIYFIKETEADAMIKNKFGYTPSDIA